jgi:hypothetical protein
MKKVKFLDWNKSTGRSLSQIFDLLEGEGPLDLLKILNPPEENSFNPRSGFKTYFIS